MLKTSLYGFDYMQIKLAFVPKVLRGGVKDSHNS